MYLLIKNQYLRNIENFINVINLSNKKKNENLLIKCDQKNNNKNLILYFSTDTFKTKFLLKENYEDLEIKKLGQATINTNFFYSLLNTLKNNNSLEIYKTEDNSLQILSEGFKCNLSVLQDLEIEEIKTKGQKIFIPYKTLKTIYLKFKDFCKNPENNIEKNTVLTNINLKKRKDQNTLSVLSSDSYKTIYGKFDLSNNDEFEINISPYILNLVLELFSNYSSENIEIWSNNNEFICKNNDCLFSTKLDLNIYPDLTEWFNEERRFIFNLSKEKLVLALERNLLFSEKNIKAASYRLEEGKLHIEYKESEKGSCKEILNVDYSGEEKIEFSINSLFLKNLLKTISSKEVTFSISDSLKPIIIFDPQEANNFKQFILPLKNV